MIVNTRVVLLRSAGSSVFTDRLEVSARNDEPLTGLTEDEMFELLSLRRAMRAKPVAGPPRGQRT